MDNYGETPTEENDNKELINVNSNQYKIIVDIEYSKLLIKLESEKKDP